MTNKLKEPWKLDTNVKYSDVVKTVMPLATASLLLPVFLAREFLGIKGEKPLVEIFSCSIYSAWLLFGISILAGVFFQYLSAKWVRIAWGKKAGIFFSEDTSETRVELWMEISFWSCVLSFGIGVVLTLVFFVNYA
jgi:uncharacterized membrane protein